jgi:hypothetical protein
VVVILSLGCRFHFVHAEQAASISMYESFLAVGTSRNEQSKSGLVTIYSNEESNEWTEHSKLEPIDSNMDEYFGSKVSLFEDIVAVGAHGTNENSG